MDRIATGIAIAASFAAFVILGISGGTGAASLETASSKLERIEDRYSVLAESVGGLEASISKARDRAARLKSLAEETARPPEPPSGEVISRKAASVFASAWDAFLVNFLIAQGKIGVLEISESRALGPLASRLKDDISRLGITGEPADKASRILAEITLLDRKAERVLRLHKEPLRFEKQRLLTHARRRLTPVLRDFQFDRIMDMIEQRILGK